MAAEETEWIPPLKEIRLYGVIKPKFQYFDGSQWLEEWSSGVQGGLPKAVAITFDFPPISQFKKPDPPPLESESDDSSDETMELDNPLFEVQAKSIDARSELGRLAERLVDTSESENVIIVETLRREAPAAGALGPSGPVGPVSPLGPAGAVRPAGLGGRR
jgi:hypothetical protein